MHCVINQVYKQSQLNILTLLNLKQELFVQNLIIIKFCSFSFTFQISKNSIKGRNVRFDIAQNSNN